MTARALDESNAAWATDAVDKNGIDRSQIRAMLRLTPEERLARVEEFVESVRQIRELNEERPVR